ncbi:KRFA protein, partial [Thinocorus orbignyianus]|nr:KRFA protein [Thinocorus orbignyianus]
CLPPCEVTCPQPWSCSTSLGPCVASCGDSRAVVFAPPVVLTFPGPIFSSCPQESLVGTSFPQPLGPMISSGSGSSSGMGGYSGSGGMSSIGSSFGSGGMSG